ncbi:hypothetical protein D3C73_1513540 [compost metagenome]
MAVYLRDRFADVECRASAAHGSVSDFPQHRNDGLANAGRRPFTALHLENVCHVQHAVAAVFDDSVTGKHDDHGHVRVSCRT